MLLKLLLKLFTLNDSLIEKMEFLESSSYDVFPLTEQKRIWCFYSICDERLREKLLQLYKLSPEQFTWLNVRNDMGDLIAASTPAIEPTVAGAVFALLKSPQRRIMIKSKLVCFKCGGIGHKSNVCPSVDDVDYRKLKPPPSHITADDEYQSLPPRPVRGKLWVASTSTSTFSDGFYLDSGATLHVTHQKELLHDFSAISGSVRSYYMISLLSLDLLLVLLRTHRLKLLVKETFISCCRMVPLLLLVMCTMFQLVIETLFRFPKRLVVARCSVFCPIQFMNLA